MKLFRYSNQVNVVFSNGVSDRVTPALLDSLIHTRRVHQFEREEGWVKVGIDPIRGMGGQEYDGFDRRLN